MKLKLNESEKPIYNGVVQSIKNMPALASEYSNRKCTQCCGKGYFEIDFILPNGTVTIIDGKQSRVTRKNFNVCFCTHNRIIKSIRKDLKSA